MTYRRQLEGGGIVIEIRQYLDYICIMSGEILYGPRICFECVRQMELKA